LERKKNTKGGVSRKEVDKKFEHVIKKPFHSQKAGCAHKRLEKKAGKKRKKPNSRKRPPRNQERVKKV